MSDNFLNAVEIGIGTWAWGDTMMWGYGGDYGTDDVREAYEAARAAGVTLFDTAEVYGRGTSEELLGRFISTEGGEAVQVATKFMPFPWRFRRNALKDALRASLDRLGLESAALYQIHWPLHVRSVEVWMDEMADAIEEGLIKAVGVSNYDVQTMKRAHRALQKRGHRLASNQVPYSLLKRDVEKNGLLAECKALDIRLIAYSPLEKGLLTGKYGPDSPPPGVRAMNYARTLEKVPPLTAKLREIGERHDKTPAQIAINWSICKGALPIPGAKNARHAEQNANAAGWHLADEEVAALDALSDSI
jgi:aryl-alcohol dehydrogenase-like predicted oxidoreductase